MPHLLQAFLQAKLVLLQFSQGQSPGLPPPPPPLPPPRPPPPRAPRNPPGGAPLIIAMLTRSGAPVPGYSLSLNHLGADCAA